LDLLSDEKAVARSYSEKSPRFLSQYTVSSPSSQRPVQLKPDFIDFFPGPGFLSLLIKFFQSKNQVDDGASTWEEYYILFKTL